MAFASPALPDHEFTVGMPSRVKFSAATRGNAPITYAIDKTPSGMTFDATARTLTGTPDTATAATTYTMTATDADGDTGTQTVRITVESASPEPL